MSDPTAQKKDILHFVAAVRLFKLRYPLLPDVCEGGRRHDREADEEDVRVGIAQRAEGVKVVLE